MPSLPEDAAFQSASSESHTIGGRALPVPGDAPVLLATMNCPAPRAQRSCPVLIKPGLGQWCLAVLHVGQRRESGKTTLAQTGTTPPATQGRKPFPKARTRLWQFRECVCTCACVYTCVSVFVVHSHVCAGGKAPCICTAAGVNQAASSVTLCLVPLGQDFLLSAE